MSPRSCSDRAAPRATAGAGWPRASAAAPPGRRAPGGSGSGPSRLCRAAGLGLSTPRRYGHTNVRPRRRRWSMFSDPTCSGQLAQVRDAARRDAALAEKMLELLLRHQLADDGTVAAPVRTVLVCQCVRPEHHRLVVLLA